MPKADMQITPESPLPQEIWPQQAILRHTGSLLSANEQVVASYDLEQQTNLEYYRPLSDIEPIKNRATRPFELDYRTLSTLDIINGMGVALGDSIIGLTALYALKTYHPQLDITLYRPSRAPVYVDTLYQHAQALIANTQPLPQPLSYFASRWRAPRTACIDLGNQVFWPDFAHMPMIDFFFHALGVNPDRIPATLKSNHWLQQLALPALPAHWQQQPFVLFCHTASTPIRSIPSAQRPRLVEALWQQYQLPVLGFGPIEHAHYVDISSLSTDTLDFLAWIKQASFLLTIDSAAVHAAAGFDIPTRAIFSTIPPRLRVRDYAKCEAVLLPLEQLSHLHASSDTRALAALEQAYEQLEIKELFDL